MRKIPTLFRRDPEDMRYVTREVHPDCKWVIDGEGVPTRKYDGTCVLRLPDGRWMGRREVKVGKPRPDGFREEETDSVTGKTVGWEPDYASPFLRYLNEAIDAHVGEFEAGTYELCGPKINGNPERYDQHTLIRHADAERIHLSGPLDYDFLQAAFTCGSFLHEGIVWHHPDGRMCKIKVRDFRR